MVTMPSNILLILYAEALHSHCRLLLEGTVTTGDP